MMWPVEEIGKYSVKPSTMDKIEQSVNVIEIKDSNDQAMSLKILEFLFFTNSRHESGN